MPRSVESRVIKWFVNAYNTCNNPKIIRVLADDKQEAPDAICELEDKNKIALELTSVEAPKGTTARHSPHRNPNLSSLIKIMEKKFKNDYRVRGVDEVWLLIQLRLTLSRDLVKESIKEIVIPPRFDRVYLQWPLPEKSEGMSVNVLQLPDFKFWVPDLPRPDRYRTLFPNN